MVIGIVADMTMADIACTLQHEGTESAFRFSMYVGSPLDQFYLAAERAEQKYQTCSCALINPPGNQSGVPR